MDISTTHLPASMETSPTMQLSYFINTRSMENNPKWVQIPIGEIKPLILRDLKLILLASNQA